jgi:hypothetical protein
VLLLVIGILELFSTQDGRILGRILIAVGLAIFFQVYIFQTGIALYVWKANLK